MSTGSPLSRVLPPQEMVAAPASVQTMDFEKLYTEHFAFVWRSLKRLGVMNANLDDAVQDVFFVAHRQLAGFEGRSTLKSWLFGIVRRVAHDYRRTAVRKDPRTRGGADGPDVQLVADERALSPQESVERADDLRVAHDLLAQLDDEKREVLVLAELEQMSIPEIAEAIGVNVNTVYSRLRAARLEFNRIVGRLQATEQRRGL